MEDENVYLTFEEAVEMLPDSDHVHTFRNPGPGIMIGADFDRTKLLEKMKQSTVRLSGKSATAMKHGMALFDDTGPLFIATKEQEEDDYG